MVGRAAGGTGSSGGGEIGLIGRAAAAAALVGGLAGGPANGFGRDRASQAPASAGKASASQRNRRNSPDLRRTATGSDPVAPTGKPSGGAAVVELGFIGNGRLKFSQGPQGDAGIMITARGRGNVFFRNKSTGSTQKPH
jgi:hypothetical protein